MGKPFVMSTDGPGTFSCSGLMRYILRTTGVDADAPWSPEGYLSKYAPVDPVNMQPGDIIIYPNWATMYVGDGMLLNANEWKGFVTHTPMEFAGVPVGIARPPYSGQPQGEAIQPLDGVVDPLVTPLDGVVDPLVTPLDGVVDPLAAPLDETLVPLDETLVQPPLDEVIQPPLDEAPLLY